MINTLDYYSTSSLVDGTTRKKQCDYDNKYSTWMRQQKDINSYAGYRYYDIDGVFWNYYTKRLVIIETKTHGVTVDDMKSHQRLTLEMMTRALKTSNEFRFSGLYLFTFENTGPEDGYTLVARFDGSVWHRNYSPEDRMNEERFVKFHQALVNRK
jgi:galactose-1-phosphate uridylyltransferase